jgi:hypothetical protein
MRLYPEELRLAQLQFSHSCLFLRRKKIDLTPTGRQSALIAARAGQNAPGDVAKVETDAAPIRLTVFTNPVPELPADCSDNNGYRAQLWNQNSYSSARASDSKHLLKSS